MTDLLHTLQDEGLREALAYYTLSGPLGQLLDAQHEDLGASRLQVFEMSHLMALGQKHLVPILLYLFHRVEQRLAEGTPPLVIVEEAWITAIHSLFGNTLESWLRTLRKKNAAVVFVSQSVADVVNSPRRDIILESCPTKILLPNAEAESDHLRRLYEGIRPQPQADPDPRHRPTQAAALRAVPAGRRLISLGLGPVALSFVGMAGRGDNRPSQRADGHPWRAVPSSARRTGSKSRRA